jgi:hypothetical protein
VSAAAGDIDEIHGEGAERSPERWAWRRKKKRRNFFAVAGQMRKATDPGVKQRLKQELARLTFGDEADDRF